MADLHDTAPGFDVRGTGEKMPEQKPKFKIPAEFDNEADFLSNMRKKYSAAVACDEFNRDAVLEDLKFLAADQWDNEVRQIRERAHKPVLTVNRLAAYVMQLVGNRRFNEVEIKVLPDTGASEEVAEVRTDLIRCIQKDSDAEVAFNTACLHQGAAGIGNFQVRLREASDDVFDQDITIEAIDDPLAVVWDHNLTHPSGKDADFVFVIDTLTKSDFKERYPWASVADAAGDVLGNNDLRAAGWFQGDEVRVVNYWKMRARRRDLALMDDGSVLDITDKPLDTPMADGEPISEHIVSGKDGAPMMRTAWCRYAQLYICSGGDILEGPYDLPIKRLPVFRVPGVELRVGGTKQRWGIVRFLKDPQRLHNYWRSTIAEKLMMTPRAKWIASDAAVAGHEQEWRNAHLSDDPLLVYNGSSGAPPMAVPPAQLEQALIMEANTSTQDLRDVSNMHEANLGQQSNEVSGKAVLARQRVGEVGMAVYQDNLNLAIKECGAVINDLIPFVYNTPRVVKVLGADSKARMAVINDTTNDGSVDITQGKYSVTVATGPSYVTRRVEAAESMMNLVNAYPQLAGTVADLLVKYQDWPGATEFEERLKKVIPQNLLDQQDLAPEQQQEMARQQQQQAVEEQFKMAMAQAQLRQANATAEEAESKAALARANVEKVLSGIPVEQYKTVQDAAYNKAMAGLKAVEIAHNADGQRPNTADERTAE